MSKPNMEASEKAATPVETSAYAKEATRVEIIGLVTNLSLFVFKLFAGIVGKSGAMISDALHTGSDCFADIIAIIGLQLSKKEMDESHQYGHEKIECLFTAILGIILLTVAYEVGSEAVVGIYKTLKGTAEAIAVPGAIALAAAIVSIVSKEILFQYVNMRAKILKSPTLKATAWHHRSDSLSSIGALVGIAGAMLGFPILDAIASLVICLIVLKIGAEVLINSINNLLDAAAPKEIIEEIQKVCAEVDGVQKLVKVQTRQFGNKYYADVTIEVDPDISVRAGHAIADKVHDEMESEFPEIKHIYVHVDPAE